MKLFEKLYITNKTKMTVEEIIGIPLFIKILLGIENTIVIPNKILLLIRLYFNNRLLFLT